VERLQRAGFTPYQVKGVSHFYKIPVSKIVCIRSAEDKPISPARLATVEAERDELQRKLNGYHCTARNTRIVDIRELDLAAHKVIL